MSFPKGIPTYSIMKSAIMAKKTLQLSLILSMLVSVSCSTLFDSYQSEINGVYIPKNVDEALAELNVLFPDSVKAEIRNMTEEDFIGEYHMGTGLWIRNNWELWKGSRLSRYFKMKGVKHPDHISGIILASFHRQLIGEDIQLDEQIASIKKSRKEAKKVHKLTRLPKQSKHPADSLIFAYSIGYFKDTVKSVLHLQTNSKTDSLWIYDHLYGWKRIDRERGKKLRTAKHGPDSILTVIFKD